MFKFIIFSLFLISVVNIRAAPVENEETALNFILLHNNDLHSHFEETGTDNDCTPEQSHAHQCYGGFARISTLVKQYRNDHLKRNGLPVIFLNAGDTFQGTTWFHIHKDNISSDLMNALKPDVGALGNHEFDLGINGLLPYLKNINFPITLTNLDIPENHPLIQTNAIHPSVVLNVNGTKVGVIGYLTQKLISLSNVRDENVHISPEINAINKEAEKLMQLGVNIIIALGHSGYDKDKKIAKECPLVDLVVGAHSHTFLYSGTPPHSNDKPEGPYPTVIEQENGKKVPVVQAFCHSKYLGKLELSFDKNGNLIRWNGQPILLDFKIEQDQEVLERLDIYRPEIDALSKDIITYSKVELNNNCHTIDCNIGNFVTDAMVYQRVQQYNKTASGWTDASIAFYNIGALRLPGSIGKISKSNLSSIIPFDLGLVVVHVPGSVVKAALEHSMKGFVFGDKLNNYLQMSGVRVVYDPLNEERQRVHSVEVLCHNCTIPTYEPLEEHKMYGIVIDSFIYEGGAGFTMFKPYNFIDMKITSLNAVTHYMRRFETIYPAVEGRIKFIGLNQ